MFAQKLQQARRTFLNTVVVIGITYCRKVKANFVAKKEK